MMNVMDQNWNHQYELLFSLIQVQIVTQRSVFRYAYELSIHMYFLLCELKGLRSNAPPIAPSISQFFLKKIIYLLVCAVSSLFHGLLSGCEARASHGRAFSCCEACMDSRVLGFQQLLLPGPRAVPQQSWHAGFVAPRHLGSSLNKDRTYVSCSGRRILLP